MFVADVGAVPREDGVRFVPDDEGYVGGNFARKLVALARKGHFGDVQGRSFFKSFSTSSLTFARTSEHKRLLKMLSDFTLALGCKPAIKLQK